MLVPGNGLMMRTFGATCGYPLDDNGTIATMFGLGFAPATGPGYQGITYVLTGTSPNGYALTAPASPFIAPALTTFTGRKGFGFTAPQIPATSNDFTQPTLICYDAGVGNIFRFNIYGNGDVTAESGPTGGLTTDVSLTGVSVLTAKFGMVADADTGVVHYYIDGVLVGNSNVLLDKPTGIVAHYIADGATVSVGSTVQGTLVTDAASLATYGFTPGTKTICGSPISSSTLGYPLDDDGTLAGMFGLGWVPTTPSLYNRFTYTYVSPSTPASNYALPSVARFGGSARIPVTGVVRGCELLFTSLPMGDFTGTGLTAILFNGGSVIGVEFVGAKRVSGVDTYDTSGGSTPRTLNANFRVGIIIDGNTGGVYFVSSDGTTLSNPGGATGATHVVFTMSVDDDGTAAAGQTIIESLIPNAGDMSLFYPTATLDYEDLPCPVNPVFIPPTIPTVISANTDTTGNQQTIVFSEPITGSPQIGWSWERNGNTFTPTGFSQPDTITNSIGFNAHAISTDTLTVSYDAGVGNVVSVASSTPLASFTNMAVTNNVTPVLNCGYPFSVPNGGIVLSNLDMTASYTLALGNHTNLYASPYDYPDSSRYTIINDGSIKAFEWSPSAFLPVVAGAVEQIIMIVNTAGTTIGYVSILVDSVDYHLTVNMTGFGGATYNLGATKPNYVGFEFNSLTNTFNTYVDNVLMDTRSYGAYDKAVFRMQMSATGIIAADVGEVSTMAFNSYAPSYNQIYWTSGATDNCNNPVNYTGCLFPFSQPGAGITMSQFNTLAGMTTVGGTNSYITNLPYTTNYWDTIYTFNIGTGTTVFEWIPTVFPKPVGGSTYWQQIVNFTDTAGTIIGYVTLEALSTSYNIQLYMVAGGSSSYTIGATLPTRIGVAFESAGPTVRVYVNDVQRLSDTYALADDPIVLDMDFETVNVLGGDTSKNLYMQFISGANNMTGTTYPGGATDNCGNTV